MPHANIWIRKENEEKWKAIHDKSEWINTLLLNSDDTSTYGKVKKIAGENFVSVLSERVDSDSKRLCKVHDTPLDQWGYCLQLNCKYAR